MKLREKSCIFAMQHTYNSSINDRIYTDFNKRSGVVILDAYSTTVSVCCNLEIATLSFLTS